MYCSTCGAETTPGLKYCKRCGVNLNQPAEASLPPKFPVVLTTIFLLVIGFIAVLGILAPIIATAELSKDGIRPESLWPLYLLTPLLTFGITTVLVWLLLRLIKVFQGADRPAPAKQERPAAISEYKPAQIAAPPSVMGSVTENTTRNFDSVADRVASRESVRDTK
jgi:Zn-dependent protease with chaperone function